MSFMFRNTRSRRKLTEGELIDPDDDDPTSPHSQPARTQRRASAPQRRGSSQPPGARSPRSPEQDQGQQNKGAAGRRPSPPPPPREQAHSPRSEGQGRTRANSRRHSEHPNGTRAPPPRASSSSPRNPPRSAARRFSSARREPVHEEGAEQHEQHPAPAPAPRAGRRKSAAYGRKNKGHASEPADDAEKEEEGGEEVNKWAAKPGRARRFTAYTRPELHERVYEEELITREDREREDALLDMQEQLGGK
jgi:hypothetical protein